MLHTNFADFKWKIPQTIKSSLKKHPETTTATLKTLFFTFVGDMSQVIGNTVMLAGLTVTRTSDPEIVSVGMGRIELFPVDIKCVIGNTSI